LFIPQVIYEYGSRGGMILTGEYRRTRRKTCPTALYPTLIPHGVKRSRTRLFAVRSLRLTPVPRHGPMENLSYNRRQVGRPVIEPSTFESGYTCYCCTTVLGLTFSFSVR
jgi:hypothetical protein